MNLFGLVEKKDGDIGFFFFFFFCCGLLVVVAAAAAAAAVADGRSGCGCGWCCENFLGSWIYYFIVLKAKIDALLWHGYR